MTAPATPPRTEPAPPSIPDIDLVRRIGRGGFGEVWLGVNRATGGLKAVKIVLLNRGGRTTDPAGREVVFAAAAGEEVLVRQIDSAAGEVLGDVAENVCELEGDSAVVREVHGLGRGEAPDVDRRDPHGTGHAIAVAFEVDKRVVAAAVEIHADACQDVAKTVLGHAEAADRIDDGPQHGIVDRVASQGSLCRRRQRLEAGGGRDGVGGVIHQVVGDAAEGVEGGRAPPLGLGQQLDRQREA